MGRFSTGLGYALPRKAITGLFAMITGVLLLQCGVAAADTVTSNFENFTLGTVDGQNGTPGTGSSRAWISTGPGIPGLSAYDQGVVNVATYPSGTPAVVAQLGTKAFRLSNHIVSPVYQGSTYSAPNNVPAGELDPNNEFIAQFSFVTTTPHPQANLEISVSPDVWNVGQRMSYVALVDEGDGTTVIFYEYDAAGNPVPYTLATGLTRGVVHTIRFEMLLKPGGPANDEVRMEVDGQDAGQCFTSWETLYRNDSPIYGTVPEAIDSMQFRSSVSTTETVPGINDGVPAGGGYLFNHVITSSTSGMLLPGCEVPVEKTANVRTVRPGGTVRYTITARNRGPVMARNLLVCDRLPRHQSFVSADRKLFALGRRRCLTIERLAPGQHVTFHLVSRVARDAPAGREQNSTDETPGVEPPAPPLGPGAPEPGVPPAPVPHPPTSEIPGHIVRPKPKPEGTVSVDVVRPAPPPAVTG